MTDDFAPTPAEEQAALDTLYDRGNAQPLPPPLEKGAMHSWSPAGSVIERRWPEVYAATGSDAAAQQALVATYRTMARDTGLPDAVLAELAEGDLDNRLAAVRVLNDAEAEAAETAHDAQMQADNQMLREELGPELLKRTEKFCRAHPALATILQTNGLGSRPSLVRGISAHVHSSGWGAGRT